MPINIPTDRKIDQCYCCKLEHKDVEWGGIYYCPNPFCGMSGSTYWKTKNLNVKETKDGVELLNYDGWLEKGMETLDSFSKELKDKILALEYTKNQIEKIKQEINWDK